MANVNQADIKGWGYAGQIFGLTEYAFSDNCSLHEEAAMKETTGSILKRNEFELIQYIRADGAVKHFRKPVCPGAISCWDIIKR